MIVSLFSDVKTYLCDSTTQEVIHDIRTGVEQQKIMSLRQLLSDGKQEQYDKEKKSLRGFTASGAFAGRRKFEFLKEYNGNIILDADDLPPLLLQYVRRIAEQCPYTYGCFTSPSAEGLKIIVRTTATIETHVRTFTAVLNYYQELLNVFIDESGKDIPRLCFFSHDPAAYLNEQSEIFNPKIMLNVKEKRD